VGGDAGDAGARACEGEKGKGRTLGGKDKTEAADWILTVKLLAQASIFYNFKRAYRDALSRMNFRLLTPHQLLQVMAIRLNDAWFKEL
jgi:hypothetical protein